MCKWLSLTCVIAVSVTLSSYANADQLVTGGAVAPGGITFTSTTLGTITATPTATITGGTADFESPTGSPLGGLTNFKFTTNGAMTLTQSGTNFNVTQNAAANWGFSFGPNANSDTLSGTIDWTLVKDGSPFPNFLGVLTVGSCSGLDAVFCADFPVNATLGMSQTWGGNRGLAITLDTLAANHNGIPERTTLATSNVAPVPEPSSLTLFGSSLIGLGFLIRRKIRRQSV